MSYKVIPTEFFKRQARLLLKHYPHLRQDLKELHRLLQQNPKCGKPLGGNAYKIRLKNTDLEKGKRSGYRVITYVVDTNQTIRLLTIYVKHRKATVTDKEIQWILKQEGLS